MIKISHGCTIVATLLLGLAHLHLRPSNTVPTIEVQHINGNLCWRDIAQDCCHYVHESKKTAIGENTGYLSHSYVFTQLQYLHKTFIFSSYIQ